MRALALLPTLHQPTDAEAMRFGQRSVTYWELRVAAALAGQLSDARRVAIWAQPKLGKIFKAGLRPDPDRRLQ